MNATQDIVIDQLRIRASKRDAQLIANDLESSNWSIQTNHEWVFIREVPVTSPKNEMRQCLSRAVNNTLSSAVDGRLSSAEHAAAVYFSSLPQLLAFLLIDLVHRDAVKKWYWKRWDYLWSEPKSQAVNHLLWEYAEYLPAVIAELVVMSYLAEVWQELSENSAEKITEKLVHSSINDAMSEGALQSTDDSSIAESIELARHSFYKQRDGLLSWVKIVAPLKSHDKRYQLAAVIAALQCCPLLLEQNVFAVVQGFVSFIEYLKQEVQVKSQPIHHDINSDDLMSDSVIQDITGQERRKNFDVENIINTSDVDDGSSRGEKNTVADKVNNKKRIEPGFSVTTNHAGEKNDTSELFPDSGNALKALSEQEQAVQEVQAVSDSAISIEDRLGSIGSANIGNTFQTTSGGLFYLINALNGKVCQDLLHKMESGDHVHGWMWLFDLARRLGAELDVEMLGFIAAQCAYKNSEMLLDVPPLPELDEIEVILASRYNKQDFWDCSLINMPAKIIATASHIDVFYALDSVRLNVRLAGLDVNPGWVPWLGRVVTLHYHDSFAERYS